MKGILQKVLCILLLAATLTSPAQAALQTSPKFIWPETLPQGSISSVSAALNATGTKFAYIFEAPLTGTLTGLSFRTGTVTTGTSGGADVRLETIGTDGFPTGTLVGTNTNISSFAISTSNTWYDAAFTSGASVTKGTRYALVIVSDTVSVVAIASYGTSNATPVYAVPYYATYNGAAWTYGSSTSVLAGVLNYGGTYPYTPAFVPGVTQTSTTFNSGSTPDVRGLRFAIPMPMKIGGFHVYYDNDGASTFKLYASDGTTVSASLDVDQAAYPPTTAAKMLRAEFSSPVTEAANTNYYFGMEPDSGTSAGIGEMALGKPAWITATGYESYALYAVAKDPSATTSWSVAKSTPASTFTADASTDLITATGHGYVSGDTGYTIIRLATTTTLPAGLSANTDYWIVYNDANTFKLATSQANALANTTINITDAGTGTHTLSLLVPQIGIIGTAFDDGTSTSAAPSVCYQ